MGSPLNFNKSIHKALHKTLTENEKVLLMGLGITDPKGFFGTTSGFVDEFGKNRIIECPTSENAYLGHALGLALGGFSPVVHFQRMDFMLYAFDQLINNIAKWRDMFSLDRPMPIVIRTLVGIGWGQGAQHSQNLAPLLAQVPGLKVVTPSCPESASQLLQSAIADGNPVVFVEHRWLQSLEQAATRHDNYQWQIGKSLVRKKGQQCTIATWSYGVVEALRFCELFPDLDFEVVDLLTISPLNLDDVYNSVEKTKNLIVWEPAYEFSGIAAEVITRLTEKGWAGRTLRLGYTHTYPSASASQTFEHYLSLEKIIELISAKFNFKMHNPKPLRWPRDKDMSHWSPWSNT